MLGGGARMNGRGTCSRENETEWWRGSETSENKQNRGWQIWTILVDASIELTDAIDITRHIHYIFQSHVDASILSNAFAIARMSCE